MGARTVLHCHELFERWSSIHELSISETLDGLAEHTLCFFVKASRLLPVSNGYGGCSLSTAEVFADDSS